MAFYRNTAIHILIVGPSPSWYGGRRDYSKQLSYGDRA